MKASIRVASLTLGGAGQKTLAAMQAHGMRNDGTSQKRKVRETEPLVYGSLDLQTAFKSHIEGCRMNSSLKRPVMHALVQFPTSIPINEKNEKAMLQLAVKFINEHHGGDAVFAARLDRDESGRHTVDVFYAPKYIKKTKLHGEELWISNSKHGKMLCERHREEIERRHGGVFTTGPRQVGIALQAELYNFLRSKKLNLEDRHEKDHSSPDRLEPETFKVLAENKRLRHENKKLYEENTLLKMGQAMLRRMINRFKSNAEKNLSLEDPEITEDLTDQQAPKPRL